MDFNYPQPLPVPSAAPDEPPMVTVRFNREWWPIVLGMVDDTIDARRAFEGTYEQQEEAQQQVDQLRLMLMSEVIETMTPTQFIPAWAFKTIGGSWTKTIDAAFGNRPEIVALNLLGTARARLVLPAGNYNLITSYGKYATGNGIAIRIIDAAPGSTFQIVVLNNYAASSAPNHVDTSAFTLTEDFDGEIELLPSAIPGNPANTTAQLFQMAIART